jgi:hypothetical protein
MIRQLLRKKWFLVNDSPVTFTNFILTNFECLTIFTEKKREIFTQLKERIKYKNFFFKPPFYLEVSHRTFSCLIIQKFVKRNMLNILLSLKVKHCYI